MAKELLLAFTSSLAELRPEVPIEAAAERPELGRLPGYLCADTQFLEVSSDPDIVRFFAVNHLALDEVVREVLAADHRVSPRVANKIRIHARAGERPAKYFALRTLVGCLDADTAVAAAVQRRTTLRPSELLASHLGCPPDEKLLDAASLVALDDDFTTQDFVTTLLTDEFGLSAIDAASKIAMIESNGVATIATGDAATMRQLADATRERARSAGFPFRLYVAAVEDK